MIPVLLGIWIALWVNDWNENKKNQQFLNNVLGSVEKENETNVKELNAIIPRQEMLLDSLNAHLENVDVPILEILSRVQGFKIPAIKNASSQALVNSKPELMEYEVLRILAEIESEHKTLEEKTNYATSFLYRNLNASEKDEKTIFKVLLNDIIDSEHQLQKYFESLRAAL